MFALLKRWQRSDGLSEAQQAVLRALHHGWSLRSHRDIDGNKRYTLHALSGETLPVAHVDVQTLRRRRLIETNQKFPSATFLLTDLGARSADRLTGDSDSHTLTARRFG